MRPFVPLTAAWLLLALVGPSLAATGASSSLAAYSETRSFRDALDGRSMEEAISGPVDKDTSSYGDRTGATMNGQGGPAMMLTIPANGNLQQGSMSQPSLAQQASDGGELEREAGPIDDQVNVTQEPQQPATEQMMDQKAARQTQRMQASRPSMNSPVIMAMMQRNGRQQQQVESEMSPQLNPVGDTPTKSSGAPEQGFGDEQTKQPGYGRMLTLAEPQKSGPTNGAPMNGGYNGGQQNQQQEGSEQNDMIQQKSKMNGDEQKPERSYGSNGNGNGNGYDGAQQVQAAKQRAMASLMKNMGNNMKYSQPANGVSMSTATSSSYGNKKSTMMGQNAMMSLANKAAYMSAQQRQMNPLMTSAMMSNNYSAMGPASRSNGAMNMKPASGMVYTSSRNLRRAKQRRAEKKMSPAMVNAMLNKMASAMQQEAGQANSVYSGQSAMSAAMQLMKSPAGAEMLAQMLSGNGDSSEQSKRQMMDTFMQQQQQEKATMDQQQYDAGNGAQEQVNEEPVDKPTGKSIANYASSTMAPNGNQIMTPNGNQRSYGETNGNQQANMGYSAMRGRQAAPSAKPAMMDMLSRNYGNQRQAVQNQMQQTDQSGYEADQQQPLSPTGQMSPAAGDYGVMSMQTPMSSQMQIPMPAVMMMVAKKEMEQQQERLPTMMMMTPASTPSYSSVQMSSNKQNSGPINAFRQGYQPTGDSGKPSSNGDSQGFSPMARPAIMMMTSTPGYEQEQQQQQSDQYGAAPMGQAEPFAFDYKIEDDYGNGQYRKEKSDKNGVVRGSYGYMDQSGIYRHVEYVADENGFRANIKSNEPGLSEPSPLKGAANGSSSKTSSPKQAGPSSTSSALGGQAAQQMSDSAGPSYNMMSNEMAPSMGSNAAGVMQQQMADSQGEQ